MVPLAKESVDIGASRQHALAAQSEPQSKPLSDQATFSAVPVEVPVQVFGSQAAADKPLRAEPFSEKTNTIIVFPRGGVLRMATAVNVGQMLVMTNLKSRNDVICRVTKIRNSSNAHAYVEVEFIQPNPTYWNAKVVSRAEAVRPEASSSTPPIEQKVALKALCASAGVSAMPLRPSPFIVRPNVATEQSVCVSNRETSIEVEANSLAPDLSSQDSTAIDTLTAPAGNKSEHEEVAAEAFTDIRDTIRLAFARVCNIQNERTPFHNQSKKRTLLLGCTAALLALVAGGMWYFRPKAQVPAGTTNAATSPLEEMPAPSAVVPLRSDSASASHDLTKSNDVVLRRPAHPRQLVPVLHTVKMHPRLAQRAINPQTSPPAISDAGSAQPTELPDVAFSAVKPPRPSGPIAVGGVVKEPKLIAARLPAYPVVAKQAHVQGDVVVDTQIDVDGRVMQTKIVSGPVMLRQAALDALRTWKYERPHLDGQPIQVETLVLIKFRL